MSMEELIAHAAAERAKNLEIAVEKALQGGKYGVMVVNGIADVSPIVPYGHIWDVPNNLVASFLED